METTQETLDSCPFFGDNVDGYMEWLYHNSRDTFKFVASKREAIRLGLGLVHTDSGGTCTSSNCFGTTGCKATTTNGSCQCSDPNTCVWVPAS